MQARLKTSTPRIVLGSVLLVGLALWGPAHLRAVDSDASTRTLVARETGSSLVETLEEMFPALRPRLSLRGSFEATTWRCGEERIQGLRIRRVASTHDPDDGEPVDVVFPARASGPVVAEGEGVRVVVRPRGARPVPAKVIDGKLAYLEVYPETDSLQIVDDDRTEEYLYLRSASAPVRFEYDVLEAEGASSVLVEQGRVYFRNADDQGVVILAPVVVDAAGRRSTTAARWELENETGPGAWRLVLHLDPAGLEYPLVVDPSWISTGSLGNLRGDPIGILLQTGKVLVMGRDPQAELYDIATGTWTPTAAGWLGRGNYAAVLLQSGKVLATGGQAGATFNECFLYDPVADTWNGTGPMTTPRRHHTVTLLPDGKVLAVGGIDDLNNNLSSAEIYDPSAGTWAATLSLTAGEKSQHTATQLKDGRVMVTGGQTGNPPTGPTAVTEIYDPSGPSWTPSGNLATARYQHSATLLPDANGTVLVTGGYDGFFTFFTSTEIFDPTIGGGTWTTSPASLNAGRAEHSATLLPSGRVLVVGGYVIPPLPVSPLNTAEIYDPAALPLPTWTLVPTPMSTPRYRHSATMLPDGRVLVAAGFDDTTALLTAELLDVDDNPTWDNPAVPNTTGPRRNSTATLLKDGRVLVTGGPFDDTAEVYDPAGPAWTPTGPLTHDRWFGTATLLNDGRVLLAGTNITAGGANTAELYDPVLNNWTLTGPMGGNRYDHAAVLLPCGEVLVVGGESSSGAYLATAERYNPRTDTWRSTGSLNTARRRLTATLLLDGRVLVTGGWNAGRLMSAEIYDPITEIWGPAGDMNSARDEHTAALLPSGMVLITGGTAGLQPAELYDPGSGLFVPTGTTLYPHGSGHTVTLLANGRVLLVGGFTDQTRAEVYDPVSGLWKEVVPGPIDPRHDHSATLLLDGTVLIVGGQGLLADVTAEAFDVNRGEDPAWRPILTGVTNPLVEGQPLVAVGTGFTGVGEASGGLGYMHSASNYPLVQLHRVDNDAVRWLPVDPAVGWADTDFASIPVNNCVPGPTRVTVFTNGIPSVARVIDVECLPPTITLSPVSQDICEGDTVNFTVDATGECRTFRWRKDGSPLAEGGPYTGTRTDTLTVTNATLAEAGSYDAIAELSCSSTTATSAAAALTFSNTLTNVDVSLTTTPATVCATCVGGTITESHVGGVVVTHEWGYRTVSGTGAITWIPGQTNPTYDIDGADFPGPGVYYVVARTTPGCGLPQVSVNEVAVTVTAVAPDPDEVQYFTVTSRDQENVLEWVTSTSYGDVRILYNEGVGCIFPTDPLGPATGLIDQPGAAGLRAFYQHTPLTNDVDYCYTIFSDKGGGSYSIGVSNRGRPMDTSLAVKWSFSTGTFSLTAPTVGWSGVIVTSNDHVVHAVERGVGGGVWPAPWLPIRLVNEPVQSRSPIVPITVNTANPVVYMGAQDGSVYVVDADQGGAFGGFVRGPASLGLPGQAAPAGLLTAYNGAFDYVLVGTRAGADNEFHAFDLDLNPLPPPFDNGGGIGMINGMAAVDYTGPRAFFTSRIGASPSTLWCLDLVAPTPSVFSLAWERALGNIDSSPVIMNDRVYVGSDLGAGTVYAVDVDNILADRSFNHTDGQVKGFVFPDRATADLYFATDSYVWALNDNGAAIVNRYPLLPFPGGIELDVGVVPTSAVVFIPGGTYLYVGGSDGKLYEVDMQPGAPIIKSIMLGDGLATVGAPSLDWQNSVVHVGTEAGVFYAVEVPFP